MSIKAIFFTVFDPEKGPVVLHQVPEGAIIPCVPQAPGQQLFDFHSVSKYIIPQQEFCDRLVTLCVNHYRIVGYPVCIENRKLYTRNEFIFNFALVLDENTEVSMYASVVRKLARLLRNLEEQSRFLTKQIAAEGDSEITKLERPVALGDLKVCPEASEDDAKSITSNRKTTVRSESPGQESEIDISELDLDEDGHENNPQLEDVKDHKSEVEENEFDGEDQDEDMEDVASKGKIYALCEMILEDLNNYCECMIPIDESNTINLKLFPPRPAPAPVHGWHVPLSIVQLDALNISSDLTLTRVIPFINGISSVARIAQLADTDLGLTRKAIAHLLYYGCVILLDIFQFGAIYAPTAEIGEFIEDEEMQEEARKYVCVPQPPPSSVELGSNPPPGQQRYTAPRRNAKKYAAEKQGGSTHPETKEVDRATLVYLYTTLTQGTTLKNWCFAHSTELRTVDVRRFITFGIIKGFLYRVHKYAVASSAVIDRLSASANRHRTFFDGVQNEALGRPSMSRTASTDVLESSGMPLARYLDGIHCFDEICTDVGLPEREVEQKIKRFGEGVEVICR